MGIVWKHISNKRYSSCLFLAVNTVLFLILGVLAGAAIYALDVFDSGSMLSSCFIGGGYSAVAIGFFGGILYLYQK